MQRPSLLGPIIGNPDLRVRNLETLQPFSPGRGQWPDRARKATPFRPAALDKSSALLVWQAPSSIPAEEHMTQQKPLIVVTRRLPEVIETRMMELFDCRLNIEDEPLSRSQLVEAVQEAEVLVPTVTDRIESAILSQAGSKMKLIASFGNGVDHIDLGSARERGITVTNTPDVLTEDTADMTMAMMLALPRRLSEGERLVRAGAWKGWGPTSMLGHRGRSLLRRHTSSVRPRTRPSCVGHSNRRAALRSAGRGLLGALPCSGGEPRSRACDLGCSSSSPG